MRLVLLGHSDIASVFALTRLLELLPEHEARVFFSGALQMAEGQASALSALAQHDQRLLDQLSASQALPKAMVEADDLPAPNSQEGLALVRDWAPDLVLSVRYRRILREDFIAIPRLGVLNLHSGILPDYKGVMATFWAMLHAEREIGCTLHWIRDSGIDTGPVIDIACLPADYKRTYLANVLALYPPGCRMMADAVQALARGNSLRDEAQRANAGKYFSTPQVGDLERFTAKGLRLAAPGDFATLNELFSSGK
tara:strand:+ start:3510 stop:4271 length:762 start_codon:yes stop_codon:yes gene_type:complete